MTVIFRARAVSSEGPIVFAIIILQHFSHFLVVSRVPKLTNFARSVRLGGLYVLVELRPWRNGSVAPPTNFLNTCAVGVSFA